MNETPDASRFAELYGDPLSGLSQRMAWNLWATAGMLADAYAEEAAWDLLEEELPPPPNPMPIRSGSLDSSDAATRSPTVSPPETSPCTGSRAAPARRWHSTS
ncbi:MAG: hypothetical protein M3P34_00220 [Actinomycetota bacterium]|nr:hypothetical protein [Actinomycetota bacterium]